MTEKKKEEINKFLAEWMGVKYHSQDGSDGEHLFCSCGFITHSINEMRRHIYDQGTDYFTAEACFGPGGLWEKAKESEEWEEFIHRKEDMTIGNRRYLSRIDWVVRLVNCEVFPKEWAEFLRENNDKNLLHHIKQL